MKIELNWRAVVSRLEIEEYTRRGAIKEYVPRSQRHKIFHILKYGTKICYKGPWGSELLYWDPNQELGYVWATEARSKEIIDWIRDNLFI